MMAKHRKPDMRWMRYVARLERLGDNVLIPEGYFRRFWNPQARRRNRRAARKEEAYQSMMDITTGAMTPCTRTFSTGC